MYTVANVAVAAQQKGSIFQTLFEHFQIRIAEPFRSVGSTGTTMTQCFSTTVGITVILVQKQIAERA